jgi:hypothetical protein
MPDGDKFSRLLHGKGWTKAYRLSRSQTSFNMLIDELMSSCAAALRDDLQNSATNLQNIKRIILEALEFEEVAQKSSLPDHRDLAFRQLSRKIESLSCSGAFDMVECMGKITKGVFLEFKYSDDKLNKQKVIERLAEVTIEQIVDTRFLAPVREGIMEARQFSVAEQDIWEQELKKKLAEPAKKMLVGVIRAKKKVSIKAPKKLTPRMKMSLDELNQGLKSLK